MTYPLLNVAILMAFARLYFCLLVRQLKSAILYITSLLREYSAVLSCWRMLR